MDFKLSIQTNTLQSPTTSDTRIWQIQQGTSITSPCSCSDLEWLPAPPAPQGRPMHLVAG